MIMVGITCASRGRETVEPLHIIWMVQDVPLTWVASGLIREAVHLLSQFLGVSLMKCQVLIFGIKSCCLTKSKS